MIPNKENGSNGSNHASNLWRSREAREDEINLGEIVDFLLSQKWFILGVMLFAFFWLAAYIYATPLQYKTNALIQIEGWQARC